MTAFGPDLGELKRHGIPAPQRPEETRGGAKKWTERSALLTIFLPQTHLDIDIIRQYGVQRDRYRDDSSHSFAPEASHSTTQNPIVSRLSHPTYRTDMFPCRYVSKPLGSTP